MLKILAALGFFDNKKAESMMRSEATASLHWPMDWGGWSMILERQPLFLIQ